MIEIWVGDDAVWTQKKAALTAVGKSGLCVVSDWDRTLTYPQMTNGQDTTSYLALVHAGYLGDGYRAEMEKLYVKYRGAELATDVSEVEKLRLMEEWWMAALHLLEAFGLTQDMIADVGAQEVMVLREGSDVFLNTLDQAKIPLHIVSAGLGDVIDAFLLARNLKFNTVNLIANWLKFGPEGQVVGCHLPIIHSANKTQLVSQSGLKRSCVLLLGDTLEDADMVKDFDGGTVLRLGFLNDDTASQRDVFLDVYDVVIGGRGDFTFVNDLLMSCVAL